MAKFIALIGVILLGAAFVLGVTSTDGWKGIRAMWLVASGQCAPTLVPDPVFMPRDGGCKPVASLKPAPKVKTNPDLPYAAILALTMANPLALGDGRVVRMQWKFMLEDLLEDAEAVPQDEKARKDLVDRLIIKLGRDSCAMLPASFAQDCRHRRTGHDIGADGLTTPILVEFEVTYSPTIAVGNFPKGNASLSVFSEWIDLPDPQASTLAARVETASLAAQDACAAKQNSFGNCMISLLIVGHDAPPKAQLVWLAADVGS